MDWSFALRKSDLPGTCFSPNLGSNSIYSTSALCSLRDPNQTEGNSWRSKDKRSSIHGEAEFQALKRTVVQLCEEHLDINWTAAEQSAGLDKIQAKGLARLWIMLIINYGRISRLKRNALVGKLGREQKLHFTMQAPRCHHQLRRNKAWCRTMNVCND
ncbi:LOW QUALITY PROTEIN: hypothetical protein CVT26_014194 [Gymnopilus dilepis]|uniref:Uncharacterized protein n=1 Tax=Gymnopilus dilepis TaxID=231916 RepID=A0A409VXH8_9AGAR|nr:LOW QUALITY PROTEIN: hypothetical protein CVT26_014194 [Gymnopilus dilepis]